MGARTKIEWAHDTLNLWYGCTQISPACDHCYAMRQVHRLKLGVVWNGPPVKAPRDRLEQLRGWNSGGRRWAERHGERRRVFVNSMSDFFDKRAPQAWRDEAADAFEECADLDILLVTKRPQNVRRMVPARWLAPGGWPPNVWLIVTVENQAEADRRVPVLLRIPGVAIRGLSMEPLLGPVNVMDAMWAHGDSIESFTATISWIIVGYESGGAIARHGETRWAEQLAAQAIPANVAFFFKQMRNKGPIPGHLMIREVPVTPERIHAAA